MLRFWVNSTTPAGAEALATAYPTVEVQTIDYGILERAPDVAVVPARFPWSDVGSWAELFDVLPRDSRIGRVVAKVGSDFFTIPRPNGQTAARIKLVDVKTVSVAQPACTLLPLEDGGLEWVCHSKRR